MSDIVKVIVVEDEMLIRKQLVNILEKSGYAVIAQFANSDFFLDSIPDLSPDIILFDINIKGCKDGIGLADVVNRKYHYPFIFVTSYADRATLDAAKRTRPNGYIVKPFDEKDIISTVEIALFNASQNRNRSEIDITSLESDLDIILTEKEVLTLQDTVLGLTNAQIATKQDVSINTVKTHLKSLYAKFEVSDRVRLVRKALGL